MKAYLEKILHQEVRIFPFDKVDKMPLVYRRGYRLSYIGIGNQEALLAEPIERNNLPALRKDQRRLESYTGLHCILYLENVSYYARNILIQEGIPFIWQEHQVYLPFLGMMLNNKQRKSIPVCEKISYLTQKMLLMAFYQGWQGITVTKGAALLGVTKTSVTRCFDELEALQFLYLRIKSRARQLTLSENRKKNLEAIQPLLRSPVLATFRLKECPEGKFLRSGISALAAYSMLEDNTCPTFAVPKSEISDLNLIAARLTSSEEEPACIIQEVSYKLPFEEQEALDPLSVVLTISQEDKEDPRVSMAIDEMIERYVW